MRKPPTVGQSKMMEEQQQSSILIVDDDFAKRKQWKKAFESATFRVFEAGNRFDALRYVGDAGSGIGLLVIGSMRDGAGAQFAVEAFQLRPTLPIIIVASAAYPVGIYDDLAILLEPISDAELVGTARTLLSQ